MNSREWCGLSDVKWVSKEINTVIHSRFYLVPPGLRDPLLGTRRWERLGWNIQHLSKTSEAVQPTKKP